MFPCLSRQFGVDCASPVSGGGRIGGSEPGVDNEASTSIESGGLGRGINGVQGIE